jgi:2-polyprenyl-3-methyl-5-hydroxy-6-metoxy-1,4-benzoquinol methylase
MKDTETINCLFCGSSRSTRFSKLADIVTCSSCGVTYLRTRPTQEAMYEIYQSYANETSHMRPPDTIAAAKQAGLRRPYFLNEVSGFRTNDIKGAWLDVGCGWGALLDEARDQGYKPKGIELTRNCLDFATMQLGIPVSNSQFLDSRIDNDSCSIVSMVHVLEHLPYPKQTLEKLYAILEEGGMFCGIVPNINSVGSVYLKDKWTWLDPVHHYVHYAPQTLTKVLQDAGFTVERLYTAIGDYDYNAIVATIQTNIPGAATIEKAKAMIPELEAAGKGEEIRFFVRKNKKTS